MTDNNTGIDMSLWAKDRDDMIASFHWSPDNGGHTVITFAKEDFSASLQMFIDNGLSETVDSQPRTTSSKDAYFLPNLAAYIRQTGGMRVNLTWVGRNEK